MSPKMPPAWQYELWYAMDTANRLLNEHCWTYDAKWEAQEAYDTMNHYMKIHPYGKYVDECRDLCSQLEPHLPDEFGGEDKE